VLPLAAFRHLSLKRPKGLFLITYQLTLHQQQQQQPWIGDNGCHSGIRCRQGMFFFLLYLFIHQLTSTQQRETTTSPKKPKRRVYTRCLGFRYGFLLFIQLFVTNINSTKGHDEQAQEKPKRRV